MSDLPAEVHALLLARGETVAVAESLTGGALGAALTAVPGASATFRGGVVAYATELKAELLGVDGELLDRVGPVHELVAGAMAAGVRRRLHATYGLSTTGVAGPDPQDGHQPGEVYVGIAGGARTLLTTQRLRLTGDRETVRRLTVEAALTSLRDQLAGGNAGT